MFTRRGSSEPPSARRDLLDIAVLSGDKAALFSRLAWIAVADLIVFGIVVADAEAGLARGVRRQADQAVLGRIAPGDQNLRTTGEPSAGPSRLSIPAG